MLSSPLPLCHPPLPSSPSLASAFSCSPSPSLLHAYKGELCDRPLESHLNCCARVPSLTLCALCVLLCLITPDQLCCVSIRQFICSLCLKWKDKKHKHGTVCVDCHNREARHPSSAAASPPPRPSPPLPIFSSPPLTAHSHLSPIQRSACVVLNAQGLSLDNGFIAMV